MEPNAQPQPQTPPPDESQGQSNISNGPSRPLGGDSFLQGVGPCPFYAGSGSLNPGIGGLGLATPQSSDAASSLGDETASLTETVNSVNYQFRYEHGRRYHGFEKSAYLLPNDDREQERLEGQHHAWLMSLDGKLHLAPLKKDIQSALDIATGTGNWAMDFADEYPSAKIIGTDLSPIQPQLSIPPNCSFLVEDSEEEWIWDEQFDYIHSRALGSTWRDWPGYLKKCYDYLSPGGWLELQEFMFPFHYEGNPPHDNAMLLWGEYFAQAASVGGVDMSMTSRLEPLLRGAGFVDVRLFQLRAPFSGWSKNEKEAKIGEFYGKVFDWGVSIALFMKRLGWSREEAEVFVASARKEAVKRDLRVFIPLYIYTARKPESEPGK